MKTRHFRELCAALAVTAVGVPAGLGGQVSYGQGPGYYTGAGLDGSAYPLSAPSGNQLLIGEPPVGSGVPRLAQDSAPLPAPARPQVHVPPGNGNLIPPSQPIYGGQPSYPSMPPQQSGPHAASDLAIPGAAAPNAHFGPAVGSLGQATQPIAPAFGGEYANCNQGLGLQPSQIIDQSALGSCGPALPAIAVPALGVVAPNPWIVGANALLFQRVNDQYVRFASDSNMPSYDLLSTRNVDFGTAGGWEIFAGRYFGCGRYALMANYWALYPQTITARAETMPGVNVRSNIPFTTTGHINNASVYGLELPSSHLYNRYDGTQIQRLRREEDFQNFELNLYSFALGGAARAGVAAAPACGPCDPCGATVCSGPTGGCAPIFGARCSPLRFSYLAGFRWFRYDDDLEYAASMTDTVYADSTDDVYYRNGVTNDLYGFQLGTNAIYCTGRRLSLLAGTRVGVFCNDIRYTSFAGLENQPATVVSGSNYGQPYAFTVNDTDVSVLGEGNLGLGVALTRGWTATVGYRILGISGIATAPGQVPQDFGLLGDAMTINRNSSLILHGLTLGGIYNW